MTNVSNATELNFTKYVGEVIEFQATVRDASNVLQDVSGWGLVLKGNAVSDAVDDPPTFSLSVGSGLTLVSTGVFRAVLATTGLAAGVYDYACSAPLKSDKPVLIHGRITLEEGPG